MIRLAKFVQLHKDVPCGRFVVQRESMGFILLILLQVNQLLSVDNDGKSYPENNSLNVPDSFASKAVNFLGKRDAQPGGTIISHFDLETQIHWRPSSVAELLVPFSSLQS